MARSYKRDANGRFAGGGGGSGGGGKRPAAKPVSRGTNRLTRDNAGKITSVGGNGATARGGRLKTASGKQRATQTARAIGGNRAGTIKGKVTRNPAAGAKLAGGIKSSGKGRAPATKLPGANSDNYKYNKAGLIASPAERVKMRGRDRQREKNAALASVQNSGRLRAERRAASNMESGRIQALKYSSTEYSARNATQRRAKRADANIKEALSTLERQKSTLTGKAIKLQVKAADRKAQGKSVTKAMESQFQDLRRQINKIEKRQKTRRKAIDVIASSQRRIEINTKQRVY